MSPQNHVHVRRAPSPPASRELNAPPPTILSHDLIIEILSRVSVKSLLRFRCVCKSWKSLISDPNFVKLHLHRSSTNAHLTHHRLTTVADFKDVVSCSLRSLLENPSSTIAEDLWYSVNMYSVVGACNGLICLADDVAGHETEECWVRFWNPAMRLRSEKSPCFYFDKRSFIFHKSKFGFGYDPISDTYKVVAVGFDRSGKEEDSQKTYVKVYSMGDTCWRNIQSFPAVPFLRRNHGVYLSGTLNWVAVHNFSSAFGWRIANIDQLVIVSLDLGKETYRQLLLPRGFDEVPHHQPTLGVLKDCLCFSHDCKKTHFVVWQMKEFGDENSWTQLVKVSYEDLQICGLQFRFTLMPLCLSENGDVLMVSNFGESGVLRYNGRYGRVERAEINVSKIIWIQPKVYVESLVLPC